MGQHPGWQHTSTHEAGRKPLSIWAPSRSHAKLPSAVSTLLAKEESMLPMVPPPLWAAGMSGKIEPCVTVGCRDPFY